MVEGALPLLRHRLRRQRRGQGRAGRGDPRRHQQRGQPRAELRQGLLPVEDHVRRRPVDDAAPADEGRQVRQERRVRAGVVGPGLRRDGRAVQAGAEGQGSDRGRHVRVGAVDDLRGLRRAQADEGRLPLQQYRPQCAPLHGLRRAGVHAHLRGGRADGLLRRHRAGRRLRALGREHGGDAPDPLDTRDRPAPERAEDEGRGAVGVRASLVRARRHPDHLHAPDRPGNPQLHRELHHPDEPGQSRLRRQAHHLQARQRRYRLRVAPGARAAAEGEKRGRRRWRQADELRRLREVRRPLRRGDGVEALGRSRDGARQARRAVRRSEDQGDVVLDDGVQPAHARRLVQQPRLQPASADRARSRHPATARSR